MATATIPVYIPLDMVDEFKALMESKYNLRITRDGWRMTPLRDSPSFHSSPPFYRRRPSKTTSPPKTTEPKPETKTTEPKDDEHLAHQLASTDQSPTSPTSSSAKRLDTGAFGPNMGQEWGPPGIMGYLSQPQKDSGPLPVDAKRVPRTRAQVRAAKAEPETKPKPETKPETKPKTKKLHSYHMFCKETLALYSEEELTRIEATDGPRQKWRICAEAWKVLKGECERGDWNAVQKMAALRKAADEHNAKMETEPETTGAEPKTTGAEPKTSKSTARVPTTEPWSCQVCLMANPGNQTVCICCGRVKGTVPSPVLQRAHGRVVQDGEGQGESKGQELCEDWVLERATVDKWRRPATLEELENQWLRDELGDDFDESPEGHEEVDKILAHKYLQAARSYIFLILFKGDPRPQWVNSDECECHESIVEYFETKRPWDGVSPYSPLDLYMQHRSPMTTAPFE